MTATEFSWPSMPPITPDAIVTAASDGDTLIAHVRWEADRVEHDRRIRVEGVNAIELRAAYGREARAATVAILDPAGVPRLDRLDDGRTEALFLEHPVHTVLIHRRPDKYHGRLLAHVSLADGSDLGLRLLFLPGGSRRLASDGETPLAVPYLA